ncbi:MAG: hypothetical protein CMJ58_16085 [Planctomycetaceae bacterium]|nr:hypothetical protein [Planctomycetaceae bacterium]
MPVAARAESAADNWTKSARRQLSQAQGGDRPVSGEMLSVTRPPFKVEMNGKLASSYCEGCREFFLENPDE